MKSCMFRSFCHWQRHFLFLLATALLGLGTSVSAKPAGRQILNLELSSDQRTAKVTVPEGVENVTLQAFHRDGGWRKVLSKTATPGVMRFNLPLNGRGARWRAIGRAAGGWDKFPGNFFKGENTFGPIKSGTQNGNALYSRRLDQPAMMVADTATGESAAVVPVEADIWKIDGDTVYFFNQLRGLQVLNLKDPADPRLSASLRLPAVGQDLYVLPGAQGERTVVLLTEGWSSEGGEWTRINLVKVSNGKAEITHTQDVAGSLADSRLAGSRLILATTEWDYDGGISSDGWNVKSHLSEWLLAPDQAPTAAGETLIEGYSPLIASGADWLAVAVHPKNQWGVSDVSVFAIRPNGLVRMSPPIRTEGSVEGKFGMQWKDNVLTTISESNTSDSRWIPTTILETFHVWAPGVIHPAVVEGRLGSLELAKGERLFATRFAGDKAYVVTFLQTDPLWVVDLSDPYHPVVAGHLEVPGWSTHLEPIGDLLFSIGWESGTVAASLFDVADPAAPQLLSRLNLGEGGSFSEATWDEQALKVLPEAGLALIPLTTYDSSGSSSVVQLLDIDLNARELRLRGEIAHAFDARRSDLIGDAVVSISQRVLVTADIEDRDEPAILAEVSLAWPVDRVLAAGRHLFQIEDGSWYGGGRATVRVSPAKSPEEILSETDLGEGTVKAADYRDGKLFVLRETGSTSWLYYRSPIMDSGGKNQLILDIYDASAAPELALLGSCALDLESGGQLAVDRMLWPRPNRPAVVLDTRYSYWYGWYGPLRIAVEPAVSLAETGLPTLAKSSMMMPYRPYWVAQKAPRLVVFDTAVPASPVAGEPMDLGPEGMTSTGVSEASDGLLVLGTSQWNKVSDNTWLESGLAFQSACVVEVETSGGPVLRPLIDLPGKLFAITELDANGFLAFTRTYGDDATTLQASASDGRDAFLIASLDAAAHVVATAGGRRVFVANADGVERHRLNEQGDFVAEPALEIGWTPYSLRWMQGTLTGTRSFSLFAADGAGDTVSEWNFPTWYLNLERVAQAPDGDLLVPFGEYGTERLDR